jgi:YhcH/YjgK/YiaL family protein
LAPAAITGLDRVTPPAPFLGSDGQSATWGDFITLGDDRFVVLWPGDAHMPGIAVDAPAEVRKVVVKIAIP